MGKYTKKSSKFFENIRENNGIRERRCTVCGEWKPETIDYYYMCNKSKPEKGFQAACKICSIKDSVAYQKENREQAYEGHRRYRRTKKYLDWGKKHAQEQRDSGYRKLWEQSETGRLCLMISNKKRQEKKHTINNIEWKNCKEYFNNSCAYCGLPIEKHFAKRNGKIINMDLHKEHVIDEGKNDLRNCIPACEECNGEKFTKTLNEWYNINNPKYSKERYLKIYYWLRYDHKKYIMPKRRYKGQRLSFRIKEIENNKTRNKAG